MIRITIRLLPALLLIASMQPAWSQSSAPSPDRNISQSSGLKASIGKINVLRKDVVEGVSLQVVLENVTDKRIYLFITGDRQVSISDGQMLILKDVTGIVYCETFYAQDKATQRCLKNHGGDLSYYSYIDPHDKADVSLRYLFEHRTQRGYEPSGSLGFTLIMVSRVAHALPNSLEAQANPDSISSPELVKLNFPLVPLSDGR